MEGEIIKGDIKDVCVELKAEAERYKGITFGEWLKRRKLKQLEEKQLEEAFKNHL